MQVNGPIRQKRGPKNNRRQKSGKGNEQQQEQQQKKGFLELSPSDFKAEGEPVSFSSGPAWASQGLNKGLLPHLSLLFVSCLMSQQHASVSDGQTCSDSCTCHHNQREVADQTFYLTHLQYSDTGTTSPSTDPITPGTWHGSHWSINFQVTCMAWPGKRSTAKVGIELMSAILEAVPHLKVVQKHLCWVECSDWHLYVLGCHGLTWEFRVLFNALHPHPLVSATLALRVQVDDQVKHVQRRSEDYLRAEM